MYSLEIVIVVAVTTLIIGSLIGMLINKTWGSPTQQRTLEDRLHNTEQQLDTYKQDVAKHFVDTAQKVSDLTETYRSLHDHLSQSAMHLASSEISKAVTAAAGAPKLDGPDQDNPIEQPKDWAPRSGSIGTLSEDYGLKEEHPKADGAETQAPLATGQPEPQPPTDKTSPNS